MTSDNTCLFCLEPVGKDDLSLAMLPCMCALKHHDTCRASWNALNPYKCPLCRRTYNPVAIATDISPVPVPVAVPVHVPAVAVPMQFHHANTREEHRTMQNNTMKYSTIVLITIFIVIIIILSL